MNPFRETAPVRDISGLRIRRPGAKWRHTRLKYEPLIKCGEVIDSRCARPKLLMNIRRVDRYGLPEELRDVRTVQRSNKVATEDCSRCDRSIRPRTTERGKTVQILYGVLR